MEIHATGNSSNKEILPEHEGNSEGIDQGISWGIRLYFTVYPDLSNNTDILNFLKLYFQ